MGICACAVATKAIAQNASPQVKLQKRILKTSPRQLEADRIACKNSPITSITEFEAITYRELRYWY